MKVLFLYPFGGLVVKRSSHVMAQGILRQLLEFGHEVVVIPKNMEELEFAQKNNLSVLAIEKENFFFRFLSKLFFIQLNSLFYKNAAKTLLANKIDVIFERHTIYNPGYYLSLFSGIPYVTNDVIVNPDIQYYGTAVHKFLNRVLRSYFERHIFKIEKRAFDHANALVSHSFAYTNILIDEYKIDKHKIFQFYAMVDKNRFIDCDKELRKSELGYSADNFIVLYTGSFDALHSPELMIPIINGVKDKNIMFLLLGDGNFLSLLKDKIRNPNVRFMGRVSSEVVLQCIQAADLCIETIWNDKVLKYGADSIKIYEYMSCSKPVIASDLPGQIQLLRKYKAGILIEPYNTKEFIEAIYSVFKNAELAEEMGRNARKMIENEWNWNYTGKIINDALVYATRGK